MEDGGEKGFFHHGMEKNSSIGTVAAWRVVLRARAVMVGRVRMMKLMVVTS